MKFIQFFATGSTGLPATTLNKRNSPWFMMAGDKIVPATVVCFISSARVSAKNKPKKPESGMSYGQAA